MFIMPGEIIINKYTVVSSKISKSLPNQFKILPFLKKRLGPTKIAFERN